MWDYLVTNLWQAWAILMLVCLLMELSSGDLFLLSLAIGAVPPLVLSFFGLNIYLLLIIFAVSSLLTLLLVRPSLLRRLHGGKQRSSNMDAVINREARVSADIEEFGYGRVALDGDDWKAKAADGAKIEKNARVRVVGRNSLILTVERIK